MLSERLKVGSGVVENGERAGGESASAPTEGVVGLGVLDADVEEEEEEEAAGSGGLGGGVSLSDEAAATSGSGVFETMVERESKVGSGVEAIAKNVGLACGRRFGGGP